MDALSAVLKAVRLEGAVYFDVRATAPWVAETPGGEAVVRRMFPGSDHLISYHVITRGSCFAAARGGETVRVRAGDVIAFPHGDPHTLSSAPGMRSEPQFELFAPASDVSLPFALQVGAEGRETAHVVCGFLGCDSRPFNPLIEALPRVLHARAGDSSVVDAFVRLALSESAQPRAGGASVLSRLSEMMFIDLVRRHLAGAPAGETGWLAGLRDPLVSRALALLHAEPAAPWTLDSLARRVGLSRSALAERFATVVGQPPMQYLTRWRMQLAASHLRGSAETLVAIAERVGYESEAAFSRAFKRETGHSPDHWRRANRPDANSAR